MKIINNRFQPFALYLLIVIFLIGCQQQQDENNPPAPDAPLIEGESDGESTQDAASEADDTTEAEAELSTSMPAPTEEPAEQEPTPTAEPEMADPNAKTVLISHILAGVSGNNNHDYIALYNNSGAEVDLSGYSLMYQARPNDESTLLYSWSDYTPFVSGFYLLTREGESFSAAADAHFQAQIFNKGSLALIDADGVTVDLVGWGEMPAGSYSGTPAPKLPRGQTLVRQLQPPFTGDSNFDLFAPRTDPPIPGCSPADSGIQIEMPPAASPGGDFTITVRLSDPSAVESLAILIPAGFSAGGNEPFGVPIYQEFEAPLTETQIITLKAPNTLQTAIFRGSKALVNGVETCIPAAPLMVEGILPIGIARNIIDETVTVEGIATMYTDGFYAGSSGTKFYIEDETGGVQIFVPGGKGDVSVSLGDRVRVTGKTELYRSSLEVIPTDFATQIEVIEKAEQTFAPTEVSLLDAAENEAWVGNLVSVAGTVSRVAEFNYSFEVDLIDPEGNKLAVYIDKLTDMSVLDLEEGEDFVVTGIIESWDNNIRLNPRVQTDLSRIWPETLLVETLAPAAVSVSPIDVQIKITNYTSETQTDIFVSAPRPDGDIETVIVDDGVTATREIINWLIPQLEPGQSVMLNMSVNLSEPGQAAGNDQPVIFFPATATSNQISDPVESEVQMVFTNGILPIWAIQGSGEKSPYIGQTETTSGIITGIFPELNGFYIQSQSGDQNIATSDAIFVNIEDATLPKTLTTGMQVHVFGEISENSGQTAINMTESEAITVISATDLLDTLTPLALTPPTSGDILSYFEAREGMLVTLDGYAVAVGPTNRFGEAPLYPLSLIDHLNSDAPLIFRDSSDPISDAIIFVDDGSEAEYESGEQLPLSISTGDVVSSLVGTLAYTYGNYKIEPIRPADIIIEPSTYAEKILQPAPARSNNQVAIATFNVENFFDIFDPHPSSPPAPSPIEYEQKLAKLSAGFAAMGYPELVALQEVENIKVLEELAEQIIADGGPEYEPHLIEGSDGRGIDVAYMTRLDRVTVTSLEQRGDADGTLSREPLLLQAVVSTDQGEQTFALINNHFTSLGGGEIATLPRRTAQADWNANIAAELLAENPDLHVVVLGDLNSFRATPPLDRLEEELVHIYEKLNGFSPTYPVYTYIFEGVAQSLDHILVSESLFNSLTDIIALPISADYPLPESGDTSPFRASDHNPLIAVFEFK